MAWGGNEDNGDKIDHLETQRQKDSYMWCPLGSKMGEIVRMLHGLS